MYSIVPIWPRWSWHRSITAPMNSFGVMMSAATIGSTILLILPSGNSLGLVTWWTVLSSAVTSYGTFGAVEIRSSPNSRSRRSETISMCSRPRKPQRKPKPNATEVSGS